MIELSEDSKVEFAQEASKIAQSLNQYAGYTEFEQAVLRFQRIVEQTLSTSSFDEQGYFDLANGIVEKLRNRTDDKDVVILLVNLSRVDSDVARIYQEKGLNILVAQAVAESPDYFTTPFNRVMIFDYLYNHYYWRAQVVLAEEGVDALLYFLATQLKGQYAKKEEILTSLLSSFMSVYFSKDKAALEKIASHFGNIKSVEKKALRLLSQL